MSQWLNHVRTTTEETAREIESALGLPEHWMDTPHTSLDDTAPPPRKGPRLAQDARAAATAGRSQ